MLIGQVRIQTQLMCCFSYISGILYHIQDSLLYHPGETFQARIFVQTPSVLGLSYENIFMRSIDGTLLHLYFIRQPEEKVAHVPTLVYLHGNAGNVGHRYVQRFLCRQELVLLDFRTFFTLPLHK